MILSLLSAAILSLHIVRSQSQNWNYRSSACDYTTTADDTRTAVGPSCKQVTGAAEGNVPSAQDMASTPALGISVVAGFNANQIAFTTYPTNVTSSLYKPAALQLDEYFVGAQNSANTIYYHNIEQWPFCASKEETCYCKNGYIALIKGNDDFIVSKGTSQQTALKSECNIKNEDFTQQDKIRQTTGTVNREDEYHCKCGQPISTAEQWQWASDLCPSLNTPWRSSQNQYQNCQSNIESYDQTFSSDGTAVGNGRSLYGASQYPSMNEPPPFPMEWKGLESMQGTAAAYGSQHTFKVTVPPTSDNMMTLKFIDKFGDGWEEGKLSVYADINNQTQAGLMPITRSWTRQDTYDKHYGSDDGQNGEQDSGGRTCHPRWLLNGLEGEEATPELCRNRCRTNAQTSCTHYAWSATGRDRMERFNNFDNDGPPVTTYTTGQNGAVSSYRGRCYLYHVDYDMTVFNSEDYNNKYFPDRLPDMPDPTTGEYSNQDPANMDPMDPDNMNGGAVRRLAGDSEMPNSIEELTWAQSKAECTALGKDLCTRAQLCSDGKPMGLPMGVFFQEEWNVATKLPTTGAQVKWTSMYRFDEADGKSDATCQATRQPTWGDTNEYESSRALIMCCADNDWTNPTAYETTHETTHNLKHTPDCFTVPGTRTASTTTPGTTQGAMQDPIAAANEGYANFERYAVFKHKFIGSGKTFTVHERVLQSRGETFETEMTVTTCPAGYYCPNKMPNMCSSQTCPEANIEQYYDANLGNAAVAQIKCANFPYNGKGSAVDENSWYDDNIHGTDYGSMYNYYCPAGVAYPVKASGSNCGTGFVNNDKYLASTQGGCPELSLKKDDGGSWGNITLTVTEPGSVNAPDQTGVAPGIDLKDLTRPAQSTFQLVIKNSGEGVLEHGIQSYPTLPWLSVTREAGSGTADGTLATAAGTGSVSNQESSGFPSEIVYEMSVFTGEIGDAISTNNQASDYHFQTISFWWRCNGRTGTKDFRVKIKLVENSNMLVFPFSIEETVVAGETKVVPLFVFNIGAEEYYPFIDASDSPIANFVSLSGDSSVGNPPLPCIVSNDFTFDTSTNGLRITEPSGASCKQQVNGADDATGHSKATYENIWTAVIAATSTEIINAKEGSSVTQGSSTGTLVSDIVVETTITAAIATSIDAGVTVLQGTRRGTLKAALTNADTAFVIVHEQGTRFVTDEDIIVGTTTVVHDDISSEVIQPIELKILAPSATTFSSSVDIEIGATTKSAGQLSSMTGNAVLTSIVCVVTSGRFRDDIDLSIGGSTVAARDIDSVVHSIDTDQAGNTAADPDMPTAQEIEDAMKVRAKGDKATTGCARPVSDPYRLETKKYQRVIVTLDGNRPSRTRPYTTSLLVRGLNDKTGGDFDLITDTSRMPISMTVTPGPALAKRSTMTYTVQSDPNSESETCYIDCAASIPGYVASASNDEYGWNWASSASNVVYRNCFTNRKITEVHGQSAQGNCGDCTTYGSQNFICAGIPQQTLTPTRNSPILITITPRDNFNSLTELASGSKFVATLQGKGALINATAVVGDVSAMQSDGTYIVSMVPPVVGNFSLHIDLQQIDPSNPLATIQNPIVGSSFDVFSLEPKCPANSEVKGTTGGCQCSPGYGSGDATDPTMKVCTPCEKGKYKSEIGDFACSTCSSGTVAQNIGAKKCIYCPGGQDTSGGPPYCTACKAGQFRAKQIEVIDGTTGQSEPGTMCTKCAEGFISAVGAKKCNVCPAGQSINPAGDRCIKCALGKARASQGKCSDLTECTPTGCADCAVGLAAPSTGLENCTVCGSGKFADVPATVSCKPCEAGTFAALDKSPTCAKCPGGYFSSDIEATSCTGCPAGTFASGDGGATECTSCKATPDTLYAAAKATECSGCVSPLQILTGSMAASVEDCGCPDNTYLSEGTIRVSPVCANCPDGGYCPQGTQNITAVAAKPGYWRPTPHTKEFWKCPVSIQTGDGLNWRNWMTCYGGEKSQCAPVFDWRNVDIKSGGAKVTVLQAMEDPSIPVSITQPSGFSNYLNQTSSFKTEFKGVTLSHAIATYVSYLHSNGDTAYISSTGVQNTSNTAAKLDFLEFFGQAEGLWINGEFVSSKEITQFTKQVIVSGWMSGPLCAICPEGTGRNGDFKSDAVCEPCPADQSQNTGIVFGMFCAAFAMVVLFVYGQIKKGAHEIHLEQEHIREHNSSRPEALALGGDVDDAGFDNPMKPGKQQKRDRRGSTTVYKHEPTKFSKDTTLKSLEEHLELQKANGTLSGNMMSHKQVLTGISRIMMSYLQVVAIARAVPIAWPEEVITTLDFFAVVSAPSLSLASVDCALGSPRAAEILSQAETIEGADQILGMKLIFQKFIMTMLIPLAAWFIPLLIWGVYYMIGKACCYKKMGCKKCYPWIHTMPDKENNYRKFKNLEEVNLAELWLRTTDRYKITVMVISFLFYPTVCRGVIQMWSCQSFGTVNYLISDMSVECGTDEHMTFVVLAAIFFILFVIGIPTLGVLTLHHYMPGIHFNPTLPINEFNPVAGRAFERKDRAELLKMKLEATQVFGFMWEGLQQTGWAPMWEWSVIMSRKVVIIMIILLLQNMEPNYQLTLALIIMFAYNLLHVKFHPYDLFYHDRLEMLSLISSEMTLFGGLLITFLNEDKETCLVSKMVLPCCFCVALLFLSCPVVFVLPCCF